MYSEDKLRVQENYVVVERVLRKEETDAIVPNIVCVSECGYLVAGKHRLTVDRTRSWAARSAREDNHDLVVQYL